jgi:hypothetical protein
MDMLISSSRSGAASRDVEDPLAVLLHELAELRRQKVDHGLGRTTQAHALRRDDDGSVDEDRVRQHGVEELVVRE